MIFIEKLKNGASYAPDIEGDISFGQKCYANKSKLRLRIN